MHYPIGCVAIRGFSQMEHIIFRHANSLVARVWNHWLFHSHWHPIAIASDPILCPSAVVVPLLSLCQSSTCSNAQPPHLINTHQLQFNNLYHFLVNYFYMVHILVRPIASSFSSPIVLFSFLHFVIKKLFFIKLDEKIISIFSTI